MRTGFPRQFGYNVPLELEPDGHPVRAHRDLFYFTVVVQNDVEKKKTTRRSSSMSPRSQWNWKFGYNQVTLANGEKLDLLDRKGNPDGSEGCLGRREQDPFDVQVPEARTRRAQDR